MEPPRDLVGETVVYVPREGALEPSGILPGSGIVGVPEHGSDRVLVYYEGAKYRQSEMATLADRVFYAHGRLVDAAPVVALAALPHAALVPVGTWDARSGLISLLGEDSERLIARWLGTEVFDPDELRSQWRSH